MSKFRCAKCDYIFELDVDFLPKLCPNCGEKDSCKHEKSADELIKGI